MITALVVSIWLCLAFGAHAAEQPAVAHPEPAAATPNALSAQPPSTRETHEPSNDKAKKTNHKAKVLASNAATAAAADRPQTPPPAPATASRTQTCLDVSPARCVVQAVPSNNPCDPTTCVARIRAALADHRAAIAAELSSSKTEQPLAKRTLELTLAELCLGDLNTAPIDEACTSTPLFNNLTNEEMRTRAAQTQLQATMARLAIVTWLTLGLSMLALVGLVVIGVLAWRTPRRVVDGLARRSPPASPTPPPSQPPPQPSEIPPVLDAPSATKFAPAAISAQSEEVYGRSTVETSGAGKQFVRTGLAYSDRKDRPEAQVDRLGLPVDTPRTKTLSATEAWINQSMARLLSLADSDLDEISERAHMHFEALDAEFKHLIEPAALTALAFIWAQHDKQPSDGCEPSQFVKDQLDRIMTELAPGHQLYWTHGNVGPESIWYKLDPAYPKPLYSSGEREIVKVLYPGLQQKHAQTPIVPALIQAR